MCDCASRIVFSELLAYVHFNWDTATADNVILHFYTSGKTYAVTFSGTVLSACWYTGEQCPQLSVWPLLADNIMQLFDVLDYQNALCNIQFAAISLDWIPKYGPEEVNEVNITLWT